VWPLWFSRTARAYVPSDALNQFARSASSPKPCPASQRAVSPASPPPPLPATGPANHQLTYPVSVCTSRIRTPPFVRVTHGRCPGNLLQLPAQTRSGKRLAHCRRIQRAQNNLAGICARTIHPGPCSNQPFHVVRDIRLKVVLLEATGILFAIPPPSSPQ